MRELPTLYRQVSVGFPIHWEQPLKLHSFIGLTFPPRAGVLVAKTQILFLQHIPFSLGERLWH